MRIHHVLWKDKYADKMAHKHSVEPEEVEDVLFGEPHVRRAERGRVRGEDLYAAYGQTAAGRYLVVFFILKRNAAALPISARQMTEPERRYYAAHR